MTSPTSQRCLLALLLPIALVAWIAPAAAQVSAREQFEQDMQGRGEDSTRWSQWQYRTAPLSPAAQLDFNMAWGYVDAASAKEGDVFVIVVRNHSDQAYCLRPKLAFTGKVFQEEKITGSVRLPAHGSLRIAAMRAERRTEIVHDINAAFWPAPKGTGPELCELDEPAGLSDWLQQPGEHAFPGNRVAPPAGG